MLASFPGIPHFSFFGCVDKYTQVEDQQKNREGLGEFITLVTFSGHRRGGGPTANKLEHGQVELSTVSRVLFSGETLKTSQLDDEHIEERLN